jgi:hypothetical protein
MSDLGPFALFLPQASHFRSAPMNRHLQIRLACPKRANIWLRVSESAPLEQRFHETDPTIRRVSFRARARARPGMTIVVNGR